MKARLAALAAVVASPPLSPAPAGPRRPGWATYGADPGRTGAVAEVVARSPTIAGSTVWLALSGTPALIG